MFRENYIKIIRYNIKKIYKDDDGEEYLKTIWFVWNTPRKNQSERYRYDDFTIRAKHLNSNEVIDDD
jgi:hypothetical protein